MRRTLKILRAAITQGNKLARGAVSRTHSATMTAAAGTEHVPSNELPRLSDADYRLYNDLAKRMDHVHTHFRQTWTSLWKSATQGGRPSTMEADEVIRTGISFARGLTAHHQTEERYVFPILAQNMPEFRPDEGDLLEQHALIHQGLERFESYLYRCKRGETAFEQSALRERMESWGEVLWTHLDQEVKTLGAENMRKYWTRDEIRAFPW